MAGQGFGIGVMELIIGGCCLIVPIVIIALVAMNSGKKRD